MNRRALLGQSALLAVSTLFPGLAISQKRYGPGASDTEIRIGQTMAYSGPASAYGTLGRSAAAYFAMVNAAGGVNGRRINMLSLDDGFSPPKTVEQTRRLVEQEEVLFMFNSLGTATNTAVQKYLNTKKVPQLFLGAGGAKFTDPANFPWTMGFQPNFFLEAKIFATYLRSVNPKARIGVLYQNDDLGKDYLSGLKQGLGDQARTMVVGEQSYELSDPTIDSQLLALKSSGADVFFSATTPKFAAQALRRIPQMDWKPLHLLTVGVLSVSAVLAQAGLENAIGAIGATYYKDPNDPQWASDQDLQKWKEWMRSYYPAGDPGDSLNVLGYTFAETATQMLRQCGDDLTRDNVMRQALNLDFQPAMLLPGVRVKTGPTDYAPVSSMRLQRFDGKSWQLFGDLLTV